MFQYSLHSADDMSDPMMVAFVQPTGNVAHVGVGTNLQRQLPVSFHGPPDFSSPTLVLIIGSGLHVPG